MSVISAVSQFAYLHALCVSKALIIHIRNMHSTVIFKADKKCVFSINHDCCYPTLFIRNTLYIFYLFIFLFCIN